MQNEENNVKDFLTTDFTLVKFDALHLYLHFTALFQDFPKERQKVNAWFCSFYLFEVYLSLVPMKLSWNDYLKLPNQKTSISASISNFSCVFLNPNNFLQFEL